MEKQFVKIVKSPQERCYFFAGFFFLGPAALCMGPHEQFAFEQLSLFDMEGQES